MGKGKERCKRLLYIDDLFIIIIISIFYLYKDDLTRSVMHVIMGWFSWQWLWNNHGIFFFWFYFHPLWFSGDQKVVGFFFLKRKHRAFLSTKRQDKKKGSENKTVGPIIPHDLMLFGTAHHLISYVTKKKKPMVYGYRYNFIK